MTSVFRNQITKTTAALALLGLATLFAIPAQGANPLLTISPPSTGLTTSTGTFTPTIQLFGEADPSKLKVSLGSQDVTSWFNPASCPKAPCTLTATLTVGGGLRFNWNLLHASVSGASGSADVERLRFYVSGGLGDPSDGSGLPHQIKVTQTISDDTNSTILTIWAPTPMTFQSCDSILTIPDQSAVKVIDLDRSTLAIRDQQCLFEDQVAGYLKNLDQSDLVFGIQSMWGSTNADFTSIGGGNYSGDDNPGQLNYSIVGYGKGGTGTAFEVLTGLDYHGINGNLVNITCSNVPACGTNNKSSVQLFGFQPGNNQAFAIVPGAAGQAGSPGLPKIYVGNVQTIPFGGSSGTPTNQVLPNSSITGQPLFHTTTYSPTWTDPTAAGGFWLLTLNRTDLTLTSSQVFVTNCACGDGTTENNAMQALYTAITIKPNPEAPDYERLMLLTTVGVPFSTAGNPGMLITVLHNAYGISPYAIQSIVPDQFGNPARPGFSMVMYTPNTSDSRFYSTAGNLQQGETGALRGVFAPVHSQFYEATNVAPFNITELPFDATADDFLRHGTSAAIGSTPPVAWPQMDTLAKQSAYAWLSNKVVTYISCSGANNCDCGFDVQSCHDVRSFYTTDQVTSVYKLQPSTILYPGDGNGFGNDEFNAVKNQLALESAALTNVNNFRTYMENLNNGASANVALALTTGANEVSAQLNQALPNPEVPTSESGVHFTADLFNTFAGLLSIPGVAFPPVGMAAGVFWTVSAILSTVDDAQKTTPQPDPYVVRLEDLISDDNKKAAAEAARFNTNLTNATDLYFDGVFSDWFRLQTVGLLSTSSGAEGWFVADTAAAPAGYIAALTASVRTNLYRQILPQYFYSMPFLGVASLYWETKNNNTTIDVLTNLVNYYMWNWFNIGHWNGDISLGPNLSVSDMHAYTWGNRTALGQNSYCEDYTFFVSQSKDATKGQTWGDAFGTAIFGPPSDTTGQGNLNLDRNWIYDAGGIPFFPAQIVKDQQSNPAAPWIVNGGKYTEGYEYYNCAHYTQPWNINDKQPSFTNLASHTVPQLTETVTFTGYLTAGTTSIPKGNVNITINDQTNSTAIQSDGSFSYTWTTRSLTPSKYPYVVYYSFDGAPGYYRATDNTTRLTIQSTEVNVTLSATPSSPTYGDQVSLVAALQSPAGVPDATTVTFYSDGVQIGTAQSSGSQATFNKSDFTVLSNGHQLYAVYEGAGLYQKGTSQTLTLTIGKGTPDVTPQAVQPIQAGVGPTSLQGSVKKGTLIPTGTVTAKINNVTSQPPTTLGSDGSFTISFDTTTTPGSATPYGITYEYSGDGNFNSVTWQNATTITVNPNASTTTVSSSSPYQGPFPNVSLVGQEVMFTATVTGSKGAPTGSVVFKNGAATLGTGPVDTTTGIATYKTSTLAQGTYTITANYSGDSVYGISTGTMTQYVLIQGNFSGVTSQSDYVGAQTHTFAGVVSGAGPTYPTGKEVLITIAANTNNQTQAFKAPNADGSFSISVDISKLPAGQYPVEYDWGGDGILSPAKDTNTTFTVNLNSSTTTVSSSSAYGTPSVSLVGQEVTFTATVTGSKGAPTGSVVLKNGDATLGTGPVDTTTGTATYKTSSLAQGTYTITANYSGDSVYGVSTGTMTQYVLIQSNFSGISSQADYVGAQTHTFAGVISGAGPTYPTGKDVLITIAANTANQTQGFKQPNADGSFSISVDISKLPVGQYPVEYDWGGDGILSIAKDTNTTFTVNAPVATATTLTSSLNPSPQGQNVLFTATVKSGNVNPPGTVNFMDGTTTLASNVPLDTTTGIATYQTDALSFGPHSITAVYSGSFGFSGGTSSPLTQQVLLRTVVYKSANPDPVTYGSVNVYVSGQLAGEDGCCVSDYPVGQTVKITIGNSSQVVTMGDFATFGIYFPIMTLGVGTYPIQIDYAGDSKFAAMSDKSLQLSINQGTPVFSGLTPSQTIPGGTASVNLSGVISAPPANVNDLQFTTSNDQGTGGVVLPYDTTGVSTDSATYSMWIKTSVKTQQMLFQVAYATPYIFMQNDALGVRWDGAGAPWVSADTTIPISDGRWHHVAVTFDKGKITFYKDGVVTSDNFNVTTSTPGNNPLNLGGSYDHIPSFLGEMWNAKVWAKALSAADVLADQYAIVYHSGAAPDGLKFSSMFSAAMNLATNVVNEESVTPQAGVAAALDSVPSLAPATTGKVTISLNGADTQVSIGPNGYFSGSVTTGALAANAYGITYKFGGDTNFTAAPDDKSTTLTVQSNATTVVLTSSTNPAINGTTVTFTATVTSGVVKPSGTVTFMNGTTQLGDPVAIDTSTGTATYQTSTLSVGPHSITAVYSGNPDYNGGTSQVLTQQILLKTVVFKSGNPDPGTYGSAVAYVSGQLAGLEGCCVADYPVGQNVKITIGNVSQVVTMGNFATIETYFPIMSLAVGTYPIQIDYAGDSKFAPMSDASLQLTINQGTPVFSGLTPSPTIPGGTANVSLSGVISVPPTNGNVLQFTATNSEGQGGVQLPYDTTGVSTDSATYSLWLKTSVKTEQVLFTMYNFEPFFQIGNDQLKLSWNSGVPTWISADTAPVSDGRWHHIAVTFNQGKITFYKDGVATADNLAVTTVGAGGSPFNLGGSIERVPSFLGEMWNVKIWSKALSAAEILADEFAVYGSGATPDGLKFASLFDAGTNAASNIVNGETATPQVGAAAAVGALPALAPATTGKVTISVNGVDTSIPIGANGYFSGSVDTSTLAAKTYPITYKFGGDSNFNAAPDDSSTILTVQANSTTTTLTSSLNPAVFGATINFTATVTSGTVKPSGTVTFMDGTTQLGDPVTIDTTTGTATYQTSAFATGPHSITAKYSGNLDYSGSTSSVLTQTIQGLATTTSLTSSASPATYGTTVTFTATVSSGNGTPTGTVTFYDGAIALSPPVNLDNGQASYQSNSLSLGTHSIKASYDGTSTNFANSDSPVLTQTIQAIFTLTTVGSSANPAAFGANVTFTAQVASANGTPTGSVTFYDGTTALAPPVNLVSGQATYQTGSLSTGLHSIKASFDGGSSGFGKSDSAVLTQTIQATSTATALISSANPATLGTDVTFTATVTSGSGVPAGSVTFKDGTTEIGDPVALDNTGKAAYTTNALSAGPHNITAGYNGSLGYGGSQSPVLIQSVVVIASFSQLSANLPQGTTTATFTGLLSGAGPTYPDGTHLVLITVAPSQTYQLQGTAKPNSDGTFKSTIDMSSLSPGTYAVRFDYSGDSKLSSATDASSAQLVVPSSGPVTVQVFLTATPNPSVLGETVTLTATVPQIGNDMPMGNVTISEPIGPNNVLIYGNNDLVNGVATIVVDSSSAQQLAAGSHTLFATFGSLDPVYQPGATSLPYTMLVNQAEQVQQELRSLVYGSAQGSLLARNNFDGFAGMQFTVGTKPMSVSFLGRMCSEGNSRMHIVKIVSASTNGDVPGALTTVNMANCTPGQPAYAKLPSTVSLTPGTTYYLVSQERIGRDTFYEHGRISTASDIAGIKPAYFNGVNWISLDSPGEAYVLTDMGYEIQSEFPTTAFVRDYNGENRALRNNFAGFVGASFTVGTQALQVNSLGRACVANSSKAHLVKLVNATTGADVPGGSASVDMNGCTVSQFVYSDLGLPLTLKANTTYYVVSQEAVGGDKWYDQGTITTTDKAIVTDAIFSNAGGWAKQPGRNNSYGPVNFRYTPVQ